MDKYIIREGVVTAENGCLVSKNIDHPTPIALLGRLAKGSIIGVDAMLECFGDRPVQWASAAVDRHLRWLKSDSP